MWHYNKQMVILNNKLLWVQIPLGRGVLDTTLCDKVCQGLAESQWFSPGTPISSTNKTEILLKVVLNTITLTQQEVQFTQVSMYTQIIL